MTLFAEKSPYGDYLLQSNGMAEYGFLEWVFHRGMLFGSVEKWWAGGGSRANPHEGLDMALFRDGNGHVRRVGAGTLVPAMYEGEVMGIGRDYLGESVFLRHRIEDGQGRTLHTIYGHIHFSHHVRTLARVDAGEVLGSVADPGLRGKKAPAHLHITTAWIAGAVPPDRMTWKAIGTWAAESLVNPLDLMRCRYVIEELTGQM